jgi:hypothetical protein
MSKETTTPKANALQAQNQKFNFDAFDAMKDDEMKSIELENINFDEGVIHNLIAITTTDYNFQDGTKKVVIFEDRNGVQYYNGNSYVVNAIQKMEIPAPVRIVCTGKQTGKNGTYKTFSIKTLS